MPPVVIQMEPNIPGLIEMSFAEIVHCIRPPITHSWFERKPTYPYSVAKFALDHWYQSTREYIDNQSSMASAAFISNASAEEIKKREDYQLQELNKKYFTYSKFLRDLHSSMLID